MRSHLLVFLFLGLFSIVSQATELNTLLCKELTQFPVNLSRLDMLLEAGANPNCFCEVQQRTHFVSENTITIKYFNPDIPSHLLYGYPADAFIVEKIHVNPLQLALDTENYPLLRFLIKNGIDLNYTHVSSMLPLEYVFHQNKRGLIDFLLSAGANPKIMQLGCPYDLATARYLITKGANPNTITIDCAIHEKDRVEAILALRSDAKGGSLESYSFEELVEKADILEVLLKNGFPVNKPNNHIEQKTILMTAAYAGKTEAVKLLLQHKAEIDQKDALGYTALFYAIQQTNYDIIKLLLQQGAVTNVVASNGQDSPMMLAIAANQSAIVQLLFEYDYNLSTELAEISNDPLITAFQQGDYASADILIKHGEKPEKLVKYYGGYYFYNHPEQLQQALALGMSPNISLDTTYLLIAAVQDNRSDIIDILLPHHPSHSLLDNHKHSALHYAFLKKNYPLAQVLIENGANINEVIEGQPSYLHRAIVANNLVMVHLLLKNGAVVNEDDIYENPLVTAVRKGNDEIVKTLLRHEIPVDCYAVFEAIKSEDLPILMQLVHAGASPNDCKIEGQTAIQFAKSNNRSYHIEAYLKKLK